MALTADDDAREIRRVVVASDSEDDPTVDKDLQVFCPKGYTPVSGGGLIPHANETPGVAIYWDAPYAGGWEVAAHDTRGGTRPWVLTAQVVCLSGVHDVDSGGSLPAETVGGP